MNIVAVIGVAMLTTFAVLVLKPHRPEIAALLSVVGGLVVILMFVDGLRDVIDGLSNLVERTGVRSDLFRALLQIIGIAYLTEFAAGVCDEAGNGAMAKKVNLAGKIIILVLALPIINNLIEIIIGVIP
ncbi:MAG: stage III sporulation protein AD [Firmicutes bacterium]|nr:stage III sporulation protein AD [Bacillota bacterium]